jgi:hypothetical protein
MIEAIPPLPIILHGVVVCGLFYGAVISDYIKLNGRTVGEK